MRAFASAMCAALAASLCVAAPAAGQGEITLETRYMKDKKEVELDPSKAYILLQTPVAIPATFFRMPTQEERDLDADRRAEAYVEAKAKHDRKMEKYEEHLEAFKNRRRRHRPTKPEELTEASFQWPATEQRLMTTFGPLYRFAKSKGNSLYLQEVEPGEYVYYGTVNMGLGACACMGTVKFNAEAGKITTLRYDGVWLDKNGQEIGRGKIPEGVDTNDALVRVAMIIEPIDDAARDPRLPQDWFTPADLKPMSFVPNWYGAEINRIAPIPGVLAYDRDRVIDVKAEAAAKAEKEARLATEAASDTANPDDAGLVEVLQDASDDANGPVDAVSED